MGVPNVGIQVGNGRNLFMVRYNPAGERFSEIELVGGRTYWVVVRIWKSIPGAEQPFDSLDLWVDPQPTEEKKPDVWASYRRTVNRISTLGFVTNRDKEPRGQFRVSQLAAVTHWGELADDVPAWSSSPRARSTQQDAPGRGVDFTTDVVPVLQRRCFSCHAGPTPVSGHRLDVLDEVLSRTRPGDVERSLLWQRVSTTDPTMRMPPPSEGEGLSVAERDILRRWISAGVSWDSGRFPPSVPQTDHWSFQPISRPAVPQPKAKAWRQHPIDAFVARKHESLGLQPNPPTDAATLRRRIALDLTGLSSLDVDDGVSFDAGRWFERLIRSPAYGEKWARHWLDLARWSESNGHQHNRHRRHAWRYRDYVVDAFHSHRPYDQFLREQLAGGETDRQVVATGFLAAARYSGNELDKEIQRNDILTDVTNTVGSAVLGLTIECAQCHSHKFDPISLSDYYQLQAFFAQGQPGNVVLQAENLSLQPVIDQRWGIFDAVRARATENLRKRSFPEPVVVIDDEVIARMTPAERQRFQELGERIRQLPQAWAWHDSSTVHPVAGHDMRWPLPRRDYDHSTRVLARGDVKSPGPTVMPAWPSLFQAAERGTFSAHKTVTSSASLSRDDLAGWLTVREHPLTARVWVNRIWQWHFGRGLVATPNDFGTQGTPPTHPELLDWLASELVDNEWNTQHIQRLIVTSRTYQLAMEGNLENEQRDPENRYLWRHRPRRLEAELIRDNMLLIAGLLDTTVGGPSVPWSDAANSTRRSLYLEQKRNAPHPHSELFDGARGVTSCARRQVTTVPLQSLYLLNGPLSSRAAAAWAKRLQLTEPNAERQVHRAFWEAWGRAPDEAELARGRDFIEEADLEQFCHVLLNSSEFLYTRLT